MTDYVFPPAPIASLAIQGSDARFALRRVFCVGRNYSEHAREMGHDPDREPPFFFMKPADAVVPAEGVIAYPPLTADLHHEVELVVAIGKGGVDIRPDDALSHIWGYGIGIDLTRRDLQAQAKKLSRPWEWAKAFDESAPTTALQPVSAVGHPSTGRVWLKVNGEQRQAGDLAEQIWSVGEVISHASQSVALKAGDLIFTGTPAGVGALQPGDVVTAGIEGIGQLQFTLGQG
ncbi:fumarylacetoacetate hydrolase family protein [Pseudomonas sp. MWU15-20650]|uniref:fumarylacetoacetate hydrolase family protein n=1 Tax=Pseudomonas sp. MWU15-20650 TaxID=2933107 RepID=UPI002010B19E|nr:fumarylacetoacetate hydrolase family protein [Pseudomonas sp. MWU15-20650]